MKKWYVSQKKADFDAIGKKFGIDPVIARIIRNRDIITEEEIEDFLNPGVHRLHDPASMLGADEGALLILQEIRKGSRIRVIGDYDIDGTCAAFLLLKGFKSLGADVDFDIPDRVRDGYGINVRIIDKAHSDGVEVIVTCDNGISAVSEIAHARELGMRVIVTDHHEIPFKENEGGLRKEILPPADVVINPHQSGCKYPFKGLCGAVVAYKFLWQTYKRAERDTSAL
ncbi:MAG: DHH family phosphoesterase, partial [Lachnospiraceae bacterium]|nr:DHH family phosphoesterase [Lachnospiraceae bacterium]